MSIIYLIDVIKNQKTEDEIEQKRANKIARLQAKIDKLQGYETAYEYDNEEFVYDDDDNDSLTK